MTSGRAAQLELIDRDEVDEWGDWGAAEGYPVVARAAGGSAARDAAVRSAACAAARGHGRSSAASDATTHAAAVRSAARAAAASDVAVRSAEERNRAAYAAAVKSAAYAAARGQQHARAQQRARAQHGERSGPPAPPRGREHFQSARPARPTAAPVADGSPPASRGTPEPSPSRLAERSPPLASPAPPALPCSAAAPAEASSEEAAQRTRDESAATSPTEGEMWRWWAPGHSRHLQPLRRDAAATPPLRRDAAAFVFRHTGSECGVQWAILTLQDSPDFAAQVRHVSEHFEIQAADDVQVELDIQREVWHATQAPRWFAAAERRRAAARAARAFAAQSRRSRAPRQSGRRADPPRAPALGAASPATDAEVEVAAGASAQETSDALVTPPAAAPRAPPTLQEPPARRPALGPARRGWPWARWLLAAVALLAALSGLGFRSPSHAELSTAWPASAPAPNASTHSTRSPNHAELSTAWPASAP